MLLAIVSGRGLPVMAGQTVIVVDDGIATGATCFASLGALRSAQAARVVAAIPVAPSETVDELRPHVDEVYVLGTPEWFFGISEFYGAFPQVEDAEVIACLQEVRTALGKRGPGE